MPTLMKRRALIARKRKSTRENFHGFASGIFAITGIAGIVLAASLIACFFTPAAPVAIAAFVTLLVSGAVGKVLTIAGDESNPGPDADLRADLLREVSDEEASCASSGKCASDSTELSAGAHDAYDRAKRRSRGEATEQSRKINPRSKDKAPDASQGVVKP